MNHSQWKFWSGIAVGPMVRAASPAPFLVFLTAVAGGALFADATLVITDATPTYLATRPQCKDRTNLIDLGPCGSRAYIDATNLANSTSAFVSPDTFAGPNKPQAGNNFNAAFANWKAANGAGWSIVNGGDLDIKFNVSQFDAQATEVRVGGLHIQIDTSDYQAAVGGPTVDQLAWTQALFVNYQPGSPDPATPLNTLDTFSFSGGPGTGLGPGPFDLPCTALPGSAGGGISNTAASNIPANTPGGTNSYCDPIYPFQGPKTNNVNSIFDGPAAFYSRPSSFRAIALLSTVTFKTDATGAVTDKILTVYNGVSYGFDTFVPEPGYYVLLAAGLAALVWIRRRRDIASSESQG